MMGSDDDYTKYVYGQTVLLTFLIFISPIIVFFIFTACRSWMRKQRKQRPILPVSGRYAGANISVIVIEAHRCHNTKNVCSAGYPSNLKAGMWSQHNDGLPTYGEVCNEGGRMPKY